MFTIGQRIKLRREELNMTQEELAKKSGYSSKSTINLIEHDKRRMKQEKILHIANALHVSPAYLMGWVDDTDEAGNLITPSASAELDDKVAWELALFMGLRRSEIMGLKESDIDFTNNVLYVHNTRHNVDGKNVEQDTKTKRSTRMLAMPEIVALDIARLIELHALHKYDKVDYLIQDGYGKVPHPETISSRLKRLEREKGLPLVSMHGLRHTYASLLNASGIDMARISAELGHSNLTTTANIYTHIFEQASQSSRGIASAINQIADLSTSKKQLSTAKK